jgi:hypothetical protein
VAALGPLTSFTAAPKGRPDLQARTNRLVVVTGRRPRHVFHPSEGAGGGLLFGHGPILRDLSFVADRAAASGALGIGLPTTFIRYERARKVSLDTAHREALERSGGAAASISHRSRGWLGFRRTRIGWEGSYPFHRLAASFVVDPGRFVCATAQAWVGRDDVLENGPHDRPAREGLRPPKLTSAPRWSTAPRSRLRKRGVWPIRWPARPSRGEAQDEAWRRVDHGDAGGPVSGVSPAPPDGPLARSARRRPLRGDRRHANPRPRIAAAWPRDSDDRCTEAADRESTGGRECIGRASVKPRNSWLDSSTDARLLFPWLCSSDF